MRETLAGLWPYPISVSEQAASNLRGGLAYVREGRPSGAVAAFDEAIRLAPQWADAFLNRAVANEVFEKPNDGLRDYERYLPANCYRPCTGGGENTTTTGVSQAV